LDLERTTFDAGEKKRTGKMMERDEGITEYSYTTK
jgi:hypothetical protein